jgi:hypothetical protein
LKPGVANSKEAATKYAEAVQVLVSLKPEMVQLKALMDKYPHGTTGQFSSQEASDRELAKSLAESIRTQAKGPQFAGIGGNISSEELKMLDGIAPPDPLAPRAWNVVKGAATGAAMGAGAGFAVPVPGTTIGGAVGGAVSGASSAWDVNPKVVAFDAFIKHHETKIKSYAATHMKIIPPMEDGSIIGKPADYAAPVGSVKK